MKLTVVPAAGAAVSDFAVDVRAGLTAARKRLSCRWLYDDIGSALFEHICDTPEYYLTRAEQSILDARADEIARAVAPNAALVELGSGSARKTRVLIAAMIRRQGRLRYVPIDISRSMLEQSSRELAEDHAALEITAIAAEYRAGLRILRRERAQAKLVLWLGSNVGNFTRAEAARFLRGVRATLGARDRFLLGVDLRKSRAMLEAAYDDAAGVTARFNLNLLARINRELGGHFDLDGFTHRARWNERLGCMHMHLRSERAQTVAIDDLGLRVRFGAGETIFTESSYKYSLDELGRLARAGGFAVERRWLDDERRFALSLLAPTSA
jgi:L-histidine Nalpha-methyltransferase